MSLVREHFGYFASVNRSQKNFELNYVIVDKLANSQGKVCCFFYVYGIRVSLYSVCCKIAYL